VPIIVFLIFCYGLIGLAKEVGSEVSSRAAGRPGSGRQGFTDFLGEAWHGFWERQAQSLAAARAAKPVQPGARVPLRLRWQAAKATYLKANDRAATVVSQAAATVATAAKKVVEPIAPKPKPAPEPAAPKLATETGDVPDGTIRHTDEGRERWDAATKRWVPVAPEATQNPAPNRTGGKPVTAPVNAAEANTFESAVPMLNALENGVAGQQDRATAGRQYLDRVDDILDAAEQAQKQLATHTQQMGEALTERHLDTSTLAGMAAATEALDPNALSEAMEMISHLKALMDKVIAGCDAARGALAQTRANVVGRYSDAAQVVNEQLSGDARFLHGEGGAPAVPDHGGREGLRDHLQEQWKPGGTGERILAETAPRSDSPRP
jgi:hypothetical protein